MLFILPLLAAVAALFRSRAALELEILALRHQICVLQRGAKTRPRLTSVDRFSWVILSRVWDDWRSALAIVKPETVIGWHLGRDCVTLRRQQEIDGGLRNRPLDINRSSGR